MFKYLNSKDWLLIIVMIVGSICMFTFRAVQHHQYIVDPEYLTDSIGKKWYTGGGGITATYTTSDTITNYIYDTSVDTFRNIRWTIEYNDDSIPFLTSIGTSMMIIHLKKEKEWWLYWATDIMKTGWLTERTNKLRAFMSGNSIIDTKYY